MNKLTLLSLLIVLLSACKAPMIQQSERGKYQPIATNAWIEIKQNITIEAESARAFYQLGTPIHSSQLNLYEINCEVEVRDVLETTQTVTPGRFQIIRAQQDQSPIVFLPHPKTVSPQNMLAYNRDDGPTDIKRFWKFTLKSEQHPNVMHLICRGVQDPPEAAELPTAIEMQKAVGKHIDLHLF